MEPAGPIWCDRYPTSRDLADLAEPFRTSVRAFIDELVKRGCQVHVSATRRPAERAWLMRGAWDITHGLPPESVKPHDPPLDILWTYEGARAMCRKYSLAYRPSLTSRHIDGFAVDMSVVGMEGQPLYDLGASYGVHKLVSDPPHWSSDGR